MKAIAFNGSPRLLGNTSVALATVMEELDKAGIETESIQIGSEVVNPCQVCNVCLENTDGRCLIETDPVNDWFEKIKEADAVIIGSPVYFGSVTAQTKAFIDRIGRLGKANHDPFKLKVGAAVVVHRRAGALNAFNEINLFFLSAQMIVVGSKYWNLLQAHKRGEAEKDTEGLENLRILGRNIAWVMKKLAGRTQ